jgi:hypothetical protein
MYCFEMNRTEEEFYRSSLAKVIRMIDIKLNGVKKQDKNIVCDSLDDFLA